MKKHEVGYNEYGFFSWKVIFLGLYYFVYKTGRTVECKETAINVELT